MTRYKGHYIDRRLHEGNVCRMDVVYHYSHQGNHVTMDYPGHEVYNEQEVEVTFLSIVATPKDENYMEEFKKIEARKAEIASYPKSILMGSSSKWSPKPEINPTTKYLKPYD